MNSKNETRLARVNPVAFISSFYTEISFEDYHESPLWRLRRATYNLKDSDVFADFRARNSSREIAWVAEWSEPDLANRHPLAVVDRLIDVLARSDFYVCVLADARRGLNDHGSPIPVSSFVSASSYFEIELYAAAMYAKPVHLFIQEGFDPGPRLQALLRLLAFAIPEWRTQRVMSATAILDGVREVIAKHIRCRETQKAPLRRRLVRQFYIERAENSPHRYEINNVLFLNGHFEQRALPQKDLIETLITEYERNYEMPRKLSRMWLAARELMSASYLPKEVQSDSRLADFLPLWDKILVLWTSAASWSGWHGHLYAGTVAPLHSLAIIRAQFPGRHAPSGSLASAYYSIANLMPMGLRRYKCLNRSLRYIEDSLRQSGNKVASDLAVRGSIRLRLGNPWGAVSDFKRMLQIREKLGQSETMIADAMIHVGYGYLFCGRWWKGRDYLERGIQGLSINPNDPGIPRAQRKLALAYRLTGRFSDANYVYALAQEAATRLGAFDQLNR